MAKVVYTLDSTIDSFFAEAGAASSRQQCDEFATLIHKGQVQPVSIQGMNSYTVVAGANSDRIIQFRGASSLLDLDMLDLAKKTHQDLVPGCRQLRKVGNSKAEVSQLSVYEMSKLPGESYIMTRGTFGPDQRLNTIISLARFFAQSWRSGTPDDSSLSDVRAECYARFQYLVNELLERFCAVHDEIEAGLPALLDGTYPIVLTHGDFNEMNTLVDPSSGHITGVIDWAEASFQPFDFALYALENCLGVMGPSGWKWFENAGDLRQAFWTTLTEETNLTESQIELVKLAGKAGMLIRYGTAYNSSFTGMAGVHDPDDDEYRYLDALLI